MKESKENISIRNVINRNNIIFGDNIQGFPIIIVPNIVHYILFNEHEIQFVHFISILSVLKNQRPEKIYIHCDCHQLIGDYYRRVVSIANKTETQIIVREIEKPNKIFGKNLNEEWVDFHASDITRITVLKEFGGIYLDRDVYIVRSLDVFRKYEMTVDFETSKEALGSQVLIAHRNARFLKLWLDSYREYDSTQWYFNVGILPVKNILKKRPEIIHRLNGEFGIEGFDVCPKIFSEYYPNWREKYYSIHLFIRNNVLYHDWCVDKQKTPVLVFNEHNIKELDVTFGEMSRDVFEFENIYQNK